MHLSLYIDALVNENLLVEKYLGEGIINAILNLKNQGIQENNKISKKKNNKQHYDAKTLLKNMVRFECHSSNQSSFYLNYMQLFETLLPL